MMHLKNIDRLSYDQYVLKEHCWKGRLILVPYSFDEILIDKIGEK